MTLVHGLSLSAETAVCWALLRGSPPPALQTTHPVATGPTCCPLLWRAAQKCQDTAASSVAGSPLRVGPWSVKGAGDMVWCSGASEMGSEVARPQLLLLMQWGSIHDPSV